VGTSLLAFAAYTDWRWRRAPNVLWLVMAAAGLVLLVADAFPLSTLRDRWPYLVAMPVFVVAVYAAWWFGLIAGGADAKALMAIAILAPFPVALPGLPLLAGPLPASFVVLVDSLVAFLVIPVALLVGNALRGDFGFPVMLLGYRKPVAALGVGHDWPMERVDEEGRVRRVLFASRSGLELSEVQESLAKAGVQRAWVTPKIPFMLPMLVGFVLAFTVGDVLTPAIAAVLHR